MRYYQDGAVFFIAHQGLPLQIVAAPFIVKDGDMIGANRARAWFIREYASPLEIPIPVGPELLMGVEIDE